MDDKFDINKMDKQVISDPLTGGTQTVYTNKDGTFMMCIPDRAVPGAVPRPEYQYKIDKIEEKNGRKVWSWSIGNNKNQSK